MQKLLLGSIFFVISGLPFVFGQGVDNAHRLKGRIIDENSAVVPGLSLGITKDDKTSFGAITDINGDFEIGVSPGNYEIDSSEVGLKLFLKIGATETNPQNLELTVTTSTLCKKDIKNVVYPAVLKSAAPKFPAAAQAVRAMGTVRVQLSVRPDGKVISAQAVSGHPLLRAASEQAARQFEFETAAGSDLRRVIITFVFLDSGLPKRETPRFECPYRVLVEIPVVTIDISENSSRRKSKH